MPRDVCPRCNARVAVPLADDEVCPDCRSEAAWASYRDGSPLRIDRRDVAEAEARRRGEAPRATWPLWAAALAAGACGAASMVRMLELLAPRPLRPLAILHADLKGLATRVALLGLGAVAVGLGVIVVQLRSRLFRSWPQLALAGAGLLTGAVAGVLGGVLWFAAAHGYDWESLAMPALTHEIRAGAPVPAILDATVVIAAPGADGMVHVPTIGAGAVIRSEVDRAWIVTCSHVAMPYAAVASWRDAAGAHPVLVYLSDRRIVEGRVVWTAQPPLDVAVIETVIEGPPAAVPIAEDASEAQPGTNVVFAPNPFRSGWKVQQGSVRKRVMVVSPAGEYSLLCTDLPVQPGDSGTGLYDGTGHLIGLNTWAKEGGEGYTGISLPTDVMGRIMEQIENVAVRRGIAEDPR